MTRYSDVLDCVQRVRMLTKEDEAWLAGLARDGDQEARQLLIESQMRWAANVARRFLGPGMQYEDLVQAAFMGVITAVDRFDPSRGVRLTTYATWWIREALFTTLRGRHLIRTPDNVDRSLHPECECGSLSELSRANADKLVDDAAERPYGPDEIERMRASLWRLDHRDRDIILRHHAGENMRSIGLRWGISKARVGQLRERALLKLRGMLESAA